MSIQRFARNFFGAGPFVNTDGALTVDASRFLLALFNRTGMGNGIVPVVSDLLIAAGMTAADALQLTADWNLVATVAAGSGVQILLLKPGNDIEVYNSGANNLKIYPPTGLQIDALGVDQPYVLAAGKLRIFQCWGLTQLYSLGN